MDTSELVHKARKGDAAAFSELMQACQEKLYKIAYSYVKNRDDALDVVSESVYRAYVNLRTLKNPAYFDTWIIRIVINQSINFTNKNRRFALKEDMAHVTVSQKAIETDETIDLYSAIDKLEEKQKAVIILKYFEDLPLTQVAEIMERPVGTVKTYLHGALKKLRLELKEVF
ncbi:MAG: sigma-70 family RNA polymerase sigma factor [Syntrophomonadaceae bacterium]|nr:sigma-70 family RNA polymerase sigma factor [Syntrophomonadaceae bacterium]